MRGGLGVVGLHAEQHEVRPMLDLIRGRTRSGRMVSRSPSGRSSVIPLKRICRRLSVRATDVTDTPALLVAREISARRTDADDRHRCLSTHAISSLDSFTPCRVVSGGGLIVSITFLAGLRYRRGYGSRLADA